MEKQRTTRKASKRQAPKAPDHKNMHQETVIPPEEPAQRAEILPTTHVDDDPESYRLT